MEAILPGAAPTLPLTTTGASRSPKPGEAEAAGAAFAGILAAVPTGQPASVEAPAAGAPAIPADPQSSAAVATADPNPGETATAALTEASVTAANGKAAGAALSPLPADVGPSTATTPAVDAAAGAVTSISDTVAATLQAPATDVPMGTSAQGPATTTVPGNALPAPGLAAPEAPSLPAVADLASAPQATQVLLPTPAGVDVFNVVGMDVAADPAGAPPVAATNAAAPFAPATETGTPAALPELPSGNGQEAVPPEQPATDGEAGDEEAASQTGSADADPAPTPLPALPLALPQAALQSYAKVTALSAQDAAADASRPQSDTADIAPVARPAAFAATVDRALAALAMASLGDGDQTLDGLAGAAMRARGPRSDGGLATAIRAQVAEQLTRGLLDPAAEQKLTIRLQPENLGQVEAEFRALDDRLTVILRAGTPEAEQALRAGARELTDAIIDRSGRFQHVEIRVEMRDGSASRQDRPDDRQQEQRQDGNRDGRRDGRDEGRDRRPGNSQNEARAAWARAWADLGQEG